MINRLIEWFKRKWCDMAGHRWGDFRRVVVYRIDEPPFDYVPPKHGRVRYCHRCGKRHFVADEPRCRCVYEFVFPDSAVEE